MDRVHFPVKQGSSFDMGYQIYPWFHQHPLSVNRVDSFWGWTLGRRYQCARLRTFRNLYTCVCASVVTAMNLHMDIHARVHISRHGRDHATAFNNLQSHNSIGQGTM